MGVQAQFALANRAEIENEIERLVDLLDTADALDNDLEPEHDYCTAGDDGCGSTRSVDGGYAWGSREEEPGVLIPRYGEDQSTGPTNYRQACLARERRIRAEMDREARH